MHAEQPRAESENSAPALVPRGAEAEERGPTAILVLLAIVACYALALPLPGTGDVRWFWLPWIDLIRAHGLTGGYAASGTDYPPGAFMWLWGVQALADAAGVEVLGMLKASLAVAALASGWIFWCWRGSLWATVALVGALLVPSAGHGYMDVCYAAPLLLALHACQREKWLAAGVWYGLATAIKWPALIIAPFLILYAVGARTEKVVRDGGRWRPAGLALLGGVAVWLVVIALVPSVQIWSALEAAFMRHRALSPQGLNWNWIVQFVLHKTGAIGVLLSRNPPIAAVVAARLLFVAGYGVALGLFWRSRRSFAALVFFALTGFQAYFVFNIGVHENHGFLALLLAFVGLVDPWPGARARVVFVAVVANLNLLLFNGLDGLGRIDSASLHRTLLVLAALNTVFFFVLLREAWRFGRAAPVLTAAQRGG